MEIKDIIILIAIVTGIIVVNIPLLKKPKQKSKIRRIKIYRNKKIDYIKANNIDTKSTGYINSIWEEIK